MCGNKTDEITVSKTCTQNSSFSKVPLMCGVPQSSGMCAMASRTAPKKTYPSIAFSKYLFICIGKSDIQRGEETERKIFHPLVHSSSSHNGQCREPIRSQEPLPGLPRGCRVPKPWGVLDCFPRPQAGSWKGSGTSET